MTGEALYNRHARVLFDTRAYRWVNGQGALRTFDDRPAPKHWAWLSQQERVYWNALARSLAPQKAKRA